MNTPMPLDKIIKGKYKVSLVLGGGGQCFVYKVYDIEKNMEFVLKELKSDSSDSDTYKEDIYMFKKEYEILTRLEYRGLPKAYEYFEEDKGHFIVVQYIKGKNLEQLLKENKGPFEELRVVDWGIQLAETLLYLYNVKPHPVIVRDIKPSNIVLSEEEVYLIDFTVGRELIPGKRGDTIKIGSPGYAPPEQYKGQSDHKSDIYALGVTLYRLLTLYDPVDTPFQFPPLRHHNPGYSRKLEYILARAIELDPMKRYQTPEELIRDLKFVKDELTGIIHPEFVVSEFEKVKEDIKVLDKPVKSLKNYLIAVIICLIIVFIVFYFYKGQY